MMPKERWLSEALEQIPATTMGSYEPERDHREIVDSYIRPLLKRCRSTSRKAFWQWLRIQLAKSGSVSRYLSWLKESKLPPEVITPHQREAFQYTVNGDVALIKIVDGDNVAIWKIPVDKLDWALSLYPVFLKRLPDLESDDGRQRRCLETRLRKKGLSAARRQEIESKISELRQPKTFSPVPRFMLLKYVNGSQRFVHHMFLDAGPGDIVESINGDYLDFTSVSISVTSKIVTQGGVGVRKGDRPIEESEEVTLPNLYVIRSDVSQRNFEQSMLRMKFTVQGDPDTRPLRVLPNGSSSDDPGDADFAVSDAAEAV